MGRVIEGSYSWVLIRVYEECNLQAISLIHESMDESTDESADESGCAFTVCMDACAQQG